jgi:hypothetical protein
VRGPGIAIRLSSLVVAMPARKKSPGGEVPAGVKCYGSLGQKLGLLTGSVVKVQLNGAKAHFAETWRA